MRLPLLLAAATLFGTGIAFADEVVVHHDDVPPPAATSTTVEKHVSDDGCASKTVHKEDGMGDEKTVHKTNCD